MDAVKTSRRGSRRAMMMAVALLLARMAGADSAAKPETPRPCTGANVRLDNPQNQDSHFVKTSSADRTEKTGADNAGVWPGLCLANFAHNVVADQKAIWNSPLHLRALDQADKNWLVPLGVGTLFLVATDSDVMRHVGSSQAAHGNSFGNKFGNYGMAAMLTSVGILYLRGAASSDDAHSREAGFLAGEAAVNAAIVGEAMKLAFQRPRPDAANAGSFGAGGDSFPSEHALVAWSIASVIANEYPGWLSKLLAYGAASGISLSRVAARQHFPSDVVVGSALGYLVGRTVYRAHHDRVLPGARPDVFEEEATPRARTPAELGSPYVPLDSWVYAAFDRLAALGYAPSAYAGLRPWSRMECARIIAAAGEALSGDDRSFEPGPELGTSRGHPTEADRIYAALATEFASDLGRLGGSPTPEIRVDSIYTRYFGIAGTPLDDSYHFGQTLINDFGRMYGEGSNAISGASASGSAGPFAFYVRGEYQHAAALSAYSPAVQQMIGSIDVTPPQDPIHTTVIDRFRLLDAYAVWNVKTIQISAGRQSLWWGPGKGDPPNLSDNAEPMDMLRLTNPSPWRLPSFLHWLGPMRWDFFFGLMGGHHYPPDPAIDGQKLSFKPTPNLEFGFSRTIVFKPVTFGKFWSGFISVGNNIHSIPGTAAYVGDRRGGFDFSYRIPGLRKWLILYSDGMSDDNPSPLAAPQRSLMNPGIYLPQIPRVPKLDFRAELAWSDPPLLAYADGKFFYYDAGYRDCYTNDGHLIGSWVGREGHGLQLWSTYWLSPRNSVQVGYRKAHVDQTFIPSGGNIQDFSVRATFRLGPEMEVNTLLQYERWNFPVLSPLAGPDTVASVELTYYPKWKKALNVR
jgi:membrane-associated phospholipid phosphatase